MMGEESSCFSYDTKYNRGVKAYKYKLKPSKKIIAIFESWLLALCELYNGRASGASRRLSDGWHIHFEKQSGKATPGDQTGKPSHRTNSFSGPPGSLEAR